MDVQQSLGYCKKTGTVEGRRTYQQARSAHTLEKMAATEASFHELDALNQRRIFGQRLQAKIF